MGAKPDAGPGGYRRHPAEVPLHRIVVADGDRRLQVGRGREGPRWSGESDWERANDTFHQVIQAAAGNARLLATIADLHRSFPRALTWAALSERTHLLEENIAQHHRVLDAIERRDAAGAREAMREHVRAAGELIAHRLEEQHPAPAG